MYSQRVNSTRPSGSICGLRSDRVFMLTHRMSLPSACITCKPEAGPGWHNVQPKRRVDTNTSLPSGS
jgi:hypothetical protein